MKWSSSIAAEALKPDIDAVARYFGGHSYIPDDSTRQRIRRAIDDVTGIVSPVASYRFSPIRSTHPDGTITLSNEALLSLPNNVCHETAAFLSAAIGTLGKELETTCRQLAVDRHIYESTLLDAVGTAMLDNMGNYLLEKIADTSRPMALFIGARFAPGLNSYGMEYQQTLFDLADATAIDIRINEAFLMEPVKSISFFSLLGRDEMSVQQQDKCSECRMLACNFRNTPKTELRDAVSRRISR